jgi:hypothetical protein
MVSKRGSHWVRVSWVSPWVLSIFWHAKSATASARNWRIRVRQVGKSSRQVRNFASTEPALARPAGKRPSTRSAQRTKRCTFIKRDWVWTLGGVRQASTVCLRRADAWPQADRKVENCGCVS